MAKVTLVGIKHIAGTSKTTGKAFAFDTACLTGEMSDRDIERGAKGLDVLTPVIPDRYKDILCNENIGKDFDMEFYFANNRTNIGYAALASKK